MSDTQRRQLHRRQTFWGAGKQRPYYDTVETHACHGIASTYGGTISRAQASSAPTMRRYGRDRRHCRGDRKGYHPVLCSHLHAMG